MKTILAAYSPAGKILSRHLDNPKVKYVGAHISADLPVMHHWFGLKWFNKTLFDTEFGEQNINENADFGLERISLKYTRYGRYDTELVRWVSENKALVTNETGYLYVPDDILIPYALKDVLVPMMAYPVMKERMQLDNVWNFYENFVNPLVGNIFTHFAIHGLPINKGKIDTLRDLYSYARVLLEKDFVEDIVTESKVILFRELAFFTPPDNPTAAHTVFHEILGCSAQERERAIEIFKNFVGPAKIQKALPVLEHYLDAPNFKIASSDQKARWLFQVRRFRPIKSTNNKDKGRPSMPWDSVERIIAKAPHLAHLYKPAADKQSIKMLGDETQDRMLIKLLDVMAVANVCKAFLKPAEIDDEGELVKENGLHYWIASDGRIHGMYSCTDTWRPRGWKPNPLNWPSYVHKGVQRAMSLILQKEKDRGTLPEKFEKYLDVDNIPSLRSVVDVSELEPLPGSQGWCFTESDLITAELRGLGFQSGDEMLIKLLTEADTQFGIPKDPTKKEWRVRLSYADDCGYPSEKRDPQFIMKAAAKGKILGEFTTDELLRDEHGNLVHPPHDLHWSLVEWVFLAPRELYDTKIQRTGVGKVGNRCGQSSIPQMARASIENGNGLPRVITPPRRISLMNTPKPTPPPDNPGAAASNAPADPKTKQLKLRLAPNSLSLDVLQRRAAKLSLPDLKIFPETVYKKVSGYFYVMTECNHCGRRVEKDLRNMESGASVKCRCVAVNKYRDNRARMLGARFEAMRQRCERDTHVSSHNYKGRGIKVEFKSRREFVDWALAKWPNETFQNMDFDRIDNDGNYSKTNLRLVTRSINHLNRRESKTSVRSRVDAFTAQHPDISYANTTIRNLISQGLTDEQILARHAKCPTPEKRKPKAKNPKPGGWRSSAEIYAKASIPFVVSQSPVNKKLG